MRVDDSIREHIYVLLICRFVSISEIVTSLSSGFEKAHPIILQNCKRPPHGLFTFASSACAKLNIQRKLFSYLTRSVVCISAPTHGHNTNPNLSPANPDPKHQLFNRIYFNFFKFTFQMRVSLPQYYPSACRSPACYTLHVCCAPFPSSSYIKVI